MVEMLVVTAIVGVLTATISFSLTKVRTTALAARTLEDFQTIETAVIGYSVTNRVSLPTSVNYNIDDMVAGTVTAFPNFDVFLKEVPHPPAWGTYRYVGSADLSINCSAAAEGILISLVASGANNQQLSDIYDRLEKKVDSSVDSNCGTIRKQGNTLYYMIADGPADVF